MNFDPDCRACPRLATFLDEVRCRHPDYHARPVPAFGDAAPDLLIVGLAPGMQGANRSGRPFTGEYAGVLLYQTLHQFGYASAAASLSVDDGLQLTGCRITNAVKCLPPANKPEPGEIRECNRYLAAELARLPKHASILALEQIAHQAVLRALGLGFGLMRTLHAMGSGTGLACGFGQLSRFGLEQPVIAVCGDSTFYHAAMPALANAYYNGSNFLLLLLDNSATAMTAFQPHPGTGETAIGKEAPVIDLKAICEVFGAQVEVVDPFDLTATVETLLSLLQDEKGVKVLILKRECALVSAKHQKRLYRVEVEQERCLGETCGCNRLCTRLFKCPGLMWDQATGKARIDEAICTGCGVCTEICPALAIKKEKV